MMTEHNCKLRAQEHRATTDNPYQFLDSGLSNVYLVGIRYWTCSECNRQAAEIPALEQLMSVIAKTVVMKPALLSGEEIRFLRKRIGKKAIDFAAYINKTPEHLSKLENDQLPLQEDSDKLIRLTYGLFSGDEQLLSEIREKVEEWYRSIHGKQTHDNKKFKKRAGRWALAKAAAA
jgi:DNA-binding transcriptional regulator YiaG